MKLIATKRVGKELPAFTSESPGFEVVHVDDERRRVWVTGNPTTDWNFLGLEAEGRPSPFQLGDVKSTARSGLLAYCDIDPSKWSEAKPLLDVAHAPNGADKAKGLAGGVALDALVAEPKYRNVLPQVAQFIAPLVGTEDLTTSLRAHVWSEVTQAKAASVERDGRLFDELMVRLNKSRLAVLLGGRNSGVSVFLGQFRERHSEVTAATEFDPRIFVRIQTALAGFKDSVPGIAPRMNVEAVCATLAFSSHEALLIHARARSESVTGQFSLESITPEQFALKYFARLVGQRPIPPLERLLGEVDQMASHFKKSQRVLLFLSFPQLTKWVWENDGAMIADVRDELWAELKRFGLDNFDHHRNIKRRSPLGQIKRAVLLVEFHKVDLPALSHAFCKSCLLAIPQLNDVELRKLWKKRTNVDGAPDVLRQLMALTGGQPFLSDALLRIVGADPQLTVKREAQLGSLDRAYQRLRALLTEVADSAGAPVPEELEQVLPAIKTQVAHYLEWLRDNVPITAVKDRGPVMQLQKLIPGGMTIVPETSDWLSSGFVWLKSPSGDTSLGAFENYPEIEGHLFPRLVEDLVDHMKSGPLHR